KTKFQSMEISTSHRVSIGSSENSSPHFRSLQLQQIVFQRNGLRAAVSCNELRGLLGGQSAILLRLRKWLL
ncbi:hypothetical protein, partial [Sulfitobacter sp. 915]|uniref:hypothetical protein n=1 Tax=Sulfitobacter sp. 915 TaxID=3368558 RepID=UPI0037457524